MTLNPQFEQTPPRTLVQDLPRRELFFSPDFTPEEFRQRRTTLAARIGSGAYALVSSAPQLPGDELVQDALFFYLCGLETRHTYLLIGGQSGKTMMLPML